MANSEWEQKELEEKMLLARELVQYGHAVRKNNGWGLKDPQKELHIQPSGDYHSLDDEKAIQMLILEELNTYRLKADNDLFDYKHPDFETISDQTLKAQGEARRIVRMIQEERKKLGTTMDEKVNVQVASYPREFEEYIKKQALIDKLSVGEPFTVTRL